jgi:hypothetical protein
MRRMTVVALVAVLALLGAACGDDDDTGGEDVQATDDGGGDGGTTDDGGDGGGGTDGDFAQAIAGMGGCSGAAAAVSAAIIAGFNPQAAEGIDESREQLEQLASSVPDDIQEDVELLNSYMQAYSDALADFSPEDYADPEAAQQIGEAFDALEEEFPQEAMDEANDNISQWFSEECPALVGE